MPKDNTDSNCQITFNDSSSYNILKFINGQLTAIILQSVDEQDLPILLTEAIKNILTTNKINPFLGFVRALIQQANDNINNPGLDDTTPLYLAACNGRNEIVSALLDNKYIAIDKKDNVTSQTALSGALMLSKYGAANIIMDYKLNNSIKITSGEFTYLQQAISNKEDNKTLNIDNATKLINQLVPGTVSNANAKNTIDAAKKFFG